MTKKEKAIFDRFYNDALDSYMSYVVRHDTKNVPNEVLARALVMSELKHELMPSKCESDEEG